MSCPGLESACHFGKAKRQSPGEYPDRCMGKDTERGVTQVREPRAVTGCVAALVDRMLTSAEPIEGRVPVIKYSVALRASRQTDCILWRSNPSRYQ
jgi:hypothetical protein